MVKGNQERKQKNRQQKDRQQRLTNKLKLLNLKKKEWGLMKILQVNVQQLDNRDGLMSHQLQDKKQLKKKYHPIVQQYPH